VLVSVAACSAVPEYFENAKMPATTTRQRRRETKEDPVEPIDSDEQENLVSEMRAEMKRQEKSINRTFQVVAFGAALLSILCSLYVEIRQTGTLPSIARLLRWTHGGLAAGLHLLAMHTATALPASSRLKWIFYLPAVITLFVGTGALFVVRKADTVDTDESVKLHQGLLLGNILTGVAGLWLRLDSLSMQKSLQDLKASQYKHKGL
jgi:hypothetical protein